MPRFPVVAKEKKSKVEKMVVEKASTPVPLHHQAAVANPAKRPANPNPNPTIKPVITPTPKPSQTIPVGPSKPVAIAVAAVAAPAPAATPTPTPAKPVAVAAPAPAAAAAPVAEPEYYTSEGDDDGSVVQDEEDEEDDDEDEEQPQKDVPVTDTEAEMEVAVATAAPAATAPPVKDEITPVPVSPCMHCGKTSVPPKKEYRCVSKADKTIKIDHYVCAECRGSNKFCPVKLEDGSICGCSCRLRLEKERKADEEDELKTGRRKRGRRPGSAVAVATKDEASSSAVAPTTTTKRKRGGAAVNGDRKRRAVAGSVPYADGDVQNSANEEIGRVCMDCRQFCSYKQMIPHLIDFHHLNLCAYAGLNFIHDPSQEIDGKPIEVFSLERGLPDSN